VTETFETLREVTDLVEYGIPEIVSDWATLPIFTCVCGAEFWTINKDNVDFEINQGCCGFTPMMQCPVCKRYLYFEIEVSVYEARKLEEAQRERENTD